MSAIILTKAGNDSFHIRARNDGLQFLALSQLAINFYFVAKCWSFKEEKKWRANLNWREVCENLREPILRLKDIHVQFKFLL